VVAGDDSNESAAAARRILHTCPCPVWVLRPGFTGLRVLAAIDPDHDDDHNRLILELAHSQAELHGGQLHVMHAWHVTGLDLLSPAELHQEQWTELASAVERAHRTSFERTLEHAELAPGPAAHLVDGPAARAIRGLTLRYRADLVVLGAGAWHENRLGLGSTAEQVLAESKSSVLLVREPPH
jgi:nucleotide-binding universal stress UspA family protein